MTPTYTCQPGCPATTHHTNTAYRYGCRSPQATEDHRIYYKRWREGRPYRRLLDPTGTRRRIQALYALGHTCTTIATHTGLNYQVIQRLITRPDGHVSRRTHQAITTAYNTLRHTPGTCRRATARAAYHNWPTPDEWDAWGPGHIDHPEDPTPLIDQLAIDKVIAGEVSLDKLTPAEQASLYTTLTRIHNLTDGQIRYRLGLTTSQTNRLVENANRHAERLQPA